MDDITYLDSIAFIYFFIAILGYGWFTIYGPMKDKNISAGVHMERHQWMKTMVDRENRMVDLIILSNLSQGNAFFASTAIVIVGALAATLGSGYQFNAVLEHIPFTSSTETYIFNSKLIFIMIIFLVAFFKFAWAYRLTHYTSIMMGATPLRKEDNETQCCDHAYRVGELAGLAGKHSNSGLHTYYYGIAACGWFINGYIFMAATTLVVLVLYRREFHSKGLKIITTR